MSKRLDELEWKADCLQSRMDALAKADASAYGVERHRDLFKQGFMKSQNGGRASAANSDRKIEIYYKDHRGAWIFDIAVNGTSLKEAIAKRAAATGLTPSDLKAKFA